MKVILNATATWKGRGMAHMKVNRYCPTDNDMNKAKQEILKKYEELGFEGVEIDFTVMELPDTLKGNETKEK